MPYENILQVNNRHDFRAWLTDNHKTSKECYIACKRGRPREDGVFYYLDAVEEALCFGWIDSKHMLIDGVRYQRFCPRKKNSPWTELNKERCRRLERLGHMTESGRAVCPDLSEVYQFPDRIMDELKKNPEAYAFFLTTPSLYQRIRLYNVDFYYKRNRTQYEKTLSHLIESCIERKMFGEWNDYGRLLN